MPELDAQRAQLVAQKEAAEAVLATTEEGAARGREAAAKAAVGRGQPGWPGCRRAIARRRMSKARSELQSLQADLQNARAGAEPRAGAAATRAHRRTSAYDAAVARYGRLQGQVNAAAAKLKMMEAAIGRKKSPRSKADLARLQANFDLLLAGTRQEEIDEAAAQVAQLDAPRSTRST